MGNQYELTYNGNDVLRVYPNPSSDYIEINIKGLENKQYSVSLINIEGKIMLTRPVNGVKKVIINESIVSLPASSEQTYHHSKIEL